MNTSDEKYFMNWDEAFKGLENIIKAIKGCYASLWTPRAVAYRRKMGLTDDEVAAAVVIMELVPAVASGVAFSCDPRTGRRDRIAISANFGLGESVVSGAIDPDEYLLQPMAQLPEIVENKIGSKKKYTRLVQSGGTALVSAGSEENGDKRPGYGSGRLSLPWGCCGKGIRYSGGGQCAGSDEDFEGWRTAHGGR